MGVLTESFFGVLMADHLLRVNKKMAIWVQQEHANGCVVASLAMVLGKKYKEVHDELAPQVWWYDHTTEPFAANDAERETRWHKGKDFSIHGMDAMDGYRWLQDKGYAMQLRYKHVWGHEVVGDWPPKPWAPIHMCSVLVPSDKWHEVVMLEDGTILDPNRAPGTWEENFSFYKQVGHVCGLWYVGGLGQVERIK